MYDANTTLQAITTETATKTSAALNIPSGTPRRGLKARIVLTTFTGTSPTFAPVIQESADGTTYNSLASPSSGVDTLTAAGVMYIPVETSHPYIRLVSTLGGTGLSAVFFADLGVARP